MNIITAEDRAARDGVDVESVDRVLGACDQMDRIGADAHRGLSLLIPPNGVSMPPSAESITAALRDQSEERLENWTAAATECERLRKALREFGTHKKSCDELKGGLCTCGYTEACK